MHDVSNDPGSTRGLTLILETGVQNGRNGLIKALCCRVCLQVFGGSDDRGSLLTKLCHTQTTVQRVPAAGNTMFVRMHTDGSINGKGFNATWSQVEGGTACQFSHSFFPPVTLSSLVSPCPLLPPPPTPPFDFVLTYQLPQ